MNVLLIEPDALLGRTYQEALKRAGWNVSLSSTAQSAIHAADISHPDVVILEMQLVSHSGVEFLYEFRSYPDWQSIPVIVHSQVPPAEFMDSWQLLQDELGVRSYHYKPRTSLAKLLRVVHEFAPVTP